MKIFQNISKKELVSMGAGILILGCVTAWYVFEYMILPPVIMPSGAKAPEGMLSPKEAVAKMREVPGFRWETTDKIKAITDDKNEIKYWSVKTPRGYVTIPAK